MAGFRTVVSGANIICSACPGKTSTLIVHNPANFIEGFHVASDQDIVVGKNVHPFAGKCLISNEPCAPILTTPWVNTSQSILISSKAGLRSGSSLLKCDRGAFISIDDSGQCTVSEGLGVSAHGVLEFAGNVPWVGELATAANGILYVAEGDRHGALQEGVNLIIGVVPIPGKGKLGRKIGDRLVKRPKQKRVPRLGRKNAAGRKARVAKRRKVLDENRRRREAYKKKRKIADTATDIATDIAVDTAIEHPTEAVVEGLTGDGDGGETSGCNSR